MSTFLFSIFFTILFPFVKLDVLQQQPPPLTSTITPAPTAIRYDHGASLESVMLECWTKPTGLFVYTDETCHLAWKYTLLHAKIKKIASIEDIPLETVGVLKSRHQTGEIQLDLDSGFKAIFRSCSFDNYRWESELVAYEIDRLLHLHRTPPVVLRHVEWAELSDTDLDVEQETKLASVHKACHAQRLITSGAMIGYTSHDLKLITTGILSDWMGGELFSVTAPTQRLLEFVKLSIALLMFDIPEKLLQEGAHELFVPKIVDGKAARITGNYFYVYVENQRAAFSDTSFDVHHPAVPVCDRIKKKKTFQCNMNWPNTTGVARAKQRTAMRSLLMSFLSSACLFPRGIAERLLHYGSTDKSQALSLEHELRAALHSQDVHNIQPLAGVSTRLHAIFSVLVSCVKEHKATGVLIEEAIYDFVKEPPKIHYDPAGRKFEYNAQSGRWMPVDQHNGDRRQETRNSLIQMAKAELQAHDAVGLLHPSVDEMLQLAKHASLGDTDPARAIVMAVPTNNKPARPALVAASSDNQDYLALFNDA